MKITAADRKAIGWGPTYRTDCPYCDASKFNPCIRVFKVDGSKYLDWNFHTARRNAAVLNGMFIITEEWDGADLVHR